MNADSEQPRTPPGVVTIRCREHGPLVVEMPAAAGDGPLQLRVTDHRGQPFPLPDDKRAVAFDVACKIQNETVCLAGGISHPATDDLDVQPRRLSRAQHGNQINGWGIEPRRQHTH